MDPKIIDLYDAYAKQFLDRPAFFNRLVMLAGSAAAAFALIPILKIN